MTNDSFLSYFDPALRKGIVTRPVRRVVNTVWVSGGHEKKPSTAVTDSMQGNGITERPNRCNAGKDLRALRHRDMTKARPSGLAFSF